MIELDPANLPPDAVWLVLAGWFVDKVLAFIKWQVERSSNADQKSQAKLLQDIHTLVREIHARRPRG